jgi:hypothetical protein
MSDTLISSLLAAGSGLLVVLIGQAMVPFIREWGARGRDAQYLAIRVVTLLDKFVEDCASTALDSGQPNREGVFVPQVDAPKPPVYPSDVNWKSIDRTLMYLLLAVPAATERAANVVAATGENDGPPDFSDFYNTRSNEYSVLGLHVNELTEALRKKYGIPEIKNRSWDPVAYLQNELKEAKERAAASAEAWAKLGAPPPPPQGLAKYDGL